MATHISSPAFPFQQSESWTAVTDWQSLQPTSNLQPNLLHLNFNGPTVDRHPFLRLSIRISSLIHDQIYPRRLLLFLTFHFSPFHGIESQCHNRFEACVYAFDHIRSRTFNIQHPAFNSQPPHPPLALVRKASRSPRRRSYSLSQFTFPKLRALESITFQPSHSSMRHAPYAQTR